MGRKFIHSEATTVSAVTDYTTAGTFSWTCPTGVFSVLVECWGAGGGGGGVICNPPYPSWNTAVAASGGGGAFASSTINVVPGTAYSIVVGAGGNGLQTQEYGGTGGSSTFATTSVVAVGGTGGHRAFTTGVQKDLEVGTPRGAGGSASDCTGTIKFSGGYGAAGISSVPCSAGGGGGAGTTGNGGNASTTTVTAGTGKTVGGGNGGNGRTATNVGIAGNGAGGGGGGAMAYNVTAYAAYAGGEGAPGRVRLTYNVIA